MKNHVPNKITIHCAVTPNGKYINPEIIRQDHIKNRGFDNIGYHILLQPDGETQAVRPLNEVGAHVAGHNTGNIGICLLGTDKFTIKQFDSLRYQIDSLIQCFNIKKWEIYTHNMFDTAIKQAKTCPNISINKLLCWYYTGDMKTIENIILK